MIVSKGQQIVITTEGGTKSIFDAHNDLNKNPIDQIQEVPLILSNDIAITLSSNFTPFLAGMELTKGVTGILSSISGLRNFIGSGSFKQMGLQTWQSTEPIGLNIDIKLAMKTNAKKDVFDPACLLMKLPLPSLASSGTGGLIPPGPTVYSAIADTVSDVTRGSTNIGTVNGTFERGTIYGLYIGKTICLPQIVVKRVSPVFSTKTDTNGYPITCTLTIDIDSIYTATTVDIDNFSKMNTQI
jgi:hypothetical protein